MYYEIIGSHKSSFIGLVLFNELIDILHQLLMTIRCVAVNM